jgi:uncharacterized caspase-like protein
MSQILCILYLSHSRKVFAILVGISEYQSPLSKLSGCVNDCMDMKAWLKENFETQIKLLINQQATRAAILEAIEGLAKNSRIKRHDAILIFFAGHGAEVNPLAKWKIPSKRRLQMFMPYDCTMGTCRSSSP